MTKRDATRLCNAMRGLRTRIVKNLSGEREVEYSAVVETDKGEYVEVRRRVRDIVRWESGH